MSNDNPAVELKEPYVGEKVQPNRTNRMTGHFVPSSIDQPSTRPGAYAHLRYASVINGAQVAAKSAAAPN
jgi:hypothetical protein